jgi:signal transduction histidine kinase
MSGMHSLIGPRIALGVGTAMARVAVRFYFFSALLVASTIYLPHKEPHNNAGLVALAVAGAFMMGFLSWFPWDRHKTRVFTAAHLLVSSTMMALLIYFTGGSSSSYHLLFFLIILFSYFYDIAELFAITTVVALFFLLPVLYETADPYRFSSFAVTILFFYFGAYLLSLVTRYMLMKNHALERLNGEVLALTSLTSTLLEDLEEGSLPDSLASTLREYVPTTYCIVLLLDEQDHLVVRLAAPVRPVQWRFTMGSSFGPGRLPRLRQVLKTRQPEVYRVDVDELDDELAAVLSRETAAILAVPIRTGAANGGVIVFAEERHEGRAPFTNEKIHLAVAVSKQIATAVQLSHCYENLELAKHELAISHDKVIKAERLATLGEVTRAVEHEINNPLSVILNWSEVYRDDASLPDETRKKFQVIFDMAVRITDVIRKLTEINETKSVEFMQGQRMTDIS